MSCGITLSRCEAGEPRDGTEILHGTRISVGSGLSTGDECPFQGQNGAVRYDPARQDRSAVMSARADPSAQIGKFGRGREAWWKD